MTTISKVWHWRRYRHRTKEQNGKHRNRLNWFLAKVQNQFNARDIDFPIDGTKAIVHRQKNNFLPEIKAPSTRLLLQKEELRQ